MIRSIFNWRDKSYSDNEIISVLRTFNHPEDQLVIDYLFAKRLVNVFQSKRLSKLLPDKIERQDVYTDIFQKFVRKIRATENLKIRNLEAYFYHMFHLAILDKLKKDGASKREVLKKTAPADIGTFYYFLKSTDDLMNMIIQKNNYNQVQKYIQKLKPPCDSIINLMADGYSAREVAKVVDLKEGNVRARKKICLTQLNELLRINKELDHE